MSTTIEEKREEALRRLAILKEKGLEYTAPIRCFKNGTDIGMFENQGGPFKSIYYQLYLNEGQEPYDSLISEVKKFEEKEKAIVYLILCSHTVFGDLYDFFFVENDKKQWNRSQKDLRSQYPSVYCYNMDTPAFSEKGSIYFEYDHACGGIYRN